jgi:hypothetical protein
MGCCASYPLGEKGIQKKKKKNSVEELRSAEAKNDALLPSVPGRMVTNGLGNAVVVHTQQGAKGINQDAVVVWEVKILPSPNFCLLFLLPLLQPWNLSKASNYPVEYTIQMQFGCLNSHHMQLRCNSVSEREVGQIQQHFALFDYFLQLKKFVWCVFCFGYM